ncbi:hypothetical protein L3X38_037765 [Prunus dulcis]|uniref:Uncharacterized protein n=1 Tax=Prunus dulcis TaxID=3755 RepID=A0AAD4V5N2_PRUDU|nr:hypothetical protein L3X38_037765 [Prunus dulcis]
MNLLATWPTSRVEKSHPYPDSQPQEENNHMDINPNIDWEISDNSALESNAQVEFPIENFQLVGENESTQGDET